MKIRILSIALLLSLIPRSGWAFDTWWHAECTRFGMTENGFSGDARLATQVSNYLTDFNSAYLFGTGMSEEQKKMLKLKQEESYEYMHFDAIFTTADIEKNWRNIYNNTVSALRFYAADPNVKSGFRLIVLFNIIGASLHIIQDFYSHSNWVNTFNANGKLPAPVWYDVDSLERSKMKLFTGAYPNGSSPGHLDHERLNKDCTGLPLNKEAVDAARRASIDWVKRLIQATPEVPWGELKAYNIQNNPTMKNFLVKLDATFLTSSSIVAGHLDGKTPARFIFSPEKNLLIEKQKAATVLGLTMNEYFTYLGVVDNPYKIPTPYWSGFRVYFITRKLAAGLTHTGKTFTPPAK